MRLGSRPIVAAMAFVVLGPRRSTRTTSATGGLLGIYFAGTDTNARKSAMPLSLRSMVSRAARWSGNIDEGFGSSWAAGYALWSS